MERHADDHSSLRLERVDAAAHHAAGDLVVCAVGWDTEVQVLRGATRVVWEELEVPRSAAQIAGIAGVEADDEYLLEAIELLSRYGLVRHGE